MKRALIALLMASLVLFSGCISINVHQKLERNGNSRVTESIDLANFRDYMKGMNGSFELSDASLKSACDNATAQDSAISCAYDTASGTITYSKSMTPSEGGYSFRNESRFPYIVYTFSANSLPEAKPANFDTGTEGITVDRGLEQKLYFNQTDSKKSIDSLKKIGGSIEYQIEMPGEIIGARNGKIVNGTAVYDVFGLVNIQQGVVVESQELDMNAVIIAGIAIFAVVLILGFAILKITRKKSA
jgi:hypothetical protein